MLPWQRSRSQPNVTLRRLILASAAVATLVIAGCGDADVGPRMSRGLDDAREWTAELTRSSFALEPEDVSVEDLVALGYMERARLGMGSPFRLAHGASVDVRLSEELREQVAWGILAMTVDGKVYHPQWQALDSVGASPYSLSGADHGRLIERTVLASADPRAGELAVRLAYRLAMTEGLVRSNGLLPVGRAAALVRDRAVARQDGIALLRAAEDEESGVLPLLRTWRATRRFGVEQPALTRTGRRGEAAAIEAAERLLVDLRTLASGEREVEASVAVDAPEPYLTPELGARLVELPSVRGAPPQAPVRVAVEGLRQSLLRANTTRVRADRALFVERALSEESLVAAYARLGTGTRREPARVTLWAAASMRTYGQEEPWQPGAGGPTVGELKARFGLATISYDAELPSDWRPYYNRMLASALTDLQRVFPAYSAKGLSVHFGRHPLREPALAVHQPRSRTIFLPPTTAAGAIAHELAHDLDWQAATRTVGRPGQYLTDVAVRESRSALAASMANLTTATLAPPRPDEPPRMPPRPTEVFARSVDFYVAASLARMGRMNGYLTAVQDEVLTGYASSLPPDAAGAAAEAMIATLDEMSAVAADSRGWYVESYGRGRVMQAYDLTRHVLDRWNAQPAGVPSTPSAANITTMLPLGFSTAPQALHDRYLADPYCAAAINDRDGVTTARGRLVWLTAESVARRVMAERARNATGPQAEAWIGSAVQAPWMPSVTQDKLDVTTREVLDLLSASKARVPGASGRC